MYKIENKILEIINDDYSDFSINELYEYSNDQWHMYENLNLEFKIKISNWIIKNLNVGNNRVVYTTG